MTAEATFELLGNTAVPDNLQRALEDLNEPVTALARQLAAEIFRRPTPARHEVVTIAVIDLPYAVVCRHLLAGTLRARHRTLVTSAAHALLQEERSEPGQDSRSE